MKILKNNYHTHTTYCRHSTNNLEDLIKYSIDQGYQILGISEHCPYPNYDKRFPKMDELEKMMEEFSFLKNKYNNQIELHFGIESEYSKENDEYYHKLKNKKGIEYFILGNHYLGSCNSNNNIEFAKYYGDDMLYKYVQQIEDAFETEMFSSLAHPDIFFKSYKKWDISSQNATQQIINLSIKYDIPLGLNGNGLSVKYDTFDYPVEHFWDKVSESNAKVIIETDAHSLDIMSQKFCKKLFQFVKDHNLEKNIIEKLKFK